MNSLRYSDRHTVESSWLTAFSAGLNSGCYIIALKEGIGVLLWISINQWRSVECVSGIFTSFPCVGLLLDYIWKRHSRKQVSVGIYTVTIVITYNEQLDGKLGVSEFCALKTIHCEANGCDHPLICACKHSFDSGITSSYFEEKLLHVVGMRLQLHSNGKNVL